MNGIKKEEFFFFEISLSLGKIVWKSNNDLGRKEKVYIFMTHRNGRF